MLSQPIKCKDPDCQHEFTPTRKWQSFCSIRCRNNFHNRARLEELEAMKAELEELRLRNRRVRDEQKNNSK